MISTDRTDLTIDATLYSYSILAGCLIVEATCCI